LERCNRSSSLPLAKPLHGTRWINSLASWGLPPHTISLAHSRCMGTQPSNHLPKAQAKPCFAYTGFHGLLTWTCNFAFARLCKRKVLQLSGPQNFRQLCLWVCLSDCYSIVVVACLYKVCVERVQTSVVPEDREQGVTKNVNGEAFASRIVVSEGWTCASVPSTLWVRHCSSSVCFRDRN